MATQSITYNSNSFQTTSSVASTILTKDIIYEDIADKVLNLKQDTIRDGYAFLDSQLTSKKITLRGWLISDTAANLRTLIDNVKGYLRPNEKTLAIETYGGSTVYRNFTCSCESFACNEEHFHITQKPYEATFLCQPTSKATSATTVNLNSGNAITTSPYNETVAITGSYRCNPVITFTLAGAGITAMTSLKFENTTTQDWMEVARTYSASDVLEIDCENETVKVNGTAVDFTGVFVRMDNGNNSTVLTVTATAFSLTAKVVYFPTYT